MDAVGVMPGCLSNNSGKLVAVLTDEGLQPPVHATPPWQNPFVKVTIILVVVGLVVLVSGLHVWASHTSYNSCVQRYVLLNMPKAAQNIRLARCRSVGALHNRGIVLTFAGGAAVLLGLGAGFVARRSSTK